MSTPSTPFINLAPHVNLTTQSQLPLGCGREIGEEFGRSLLRNMLPVDVLEEHVTPEGFVATLLITA